MNDAILLEISQPQFRQVVAQTFKLYRTSRKNGDLLPLADSALANSSLVTDSLLAGTPLGVTACAGGTQALLHWVVDKLQPGGSQCFLSQKWRSYNLLYYPYLEGKDEEGKKWTFARLGDEIGLSRPGVYKSRRQAIKAAADILREELEKPQEVAGRQKYLIDSRYQAHSNQEQLLLRLLSLFRLPVPPTLLYQQAFFDRVDREDREVTDVPESLRRLMMGGLLVSHGTGTTVEVHREASPYLRSLLLPAERQDWHQAAGRYYQQARDYFEALYHFRQAGDYETAANILIDNYQAIVDNQQIKPLREQLGLFHSSELTDATWAKLKIKAGEAALLVEDVETALAEYAQALGTSDIPTKALAYYRRGYAFQHINLDECLIHYNFSIKLLEEKLPNEPLLVHIYIDNAFFDIQQRKRLKKAEASLERALELIQKDQRKLSVHLHNAWAGLRFHQGAHEIEQEHRLQAWLAANETQDKELMSKMAHNLGQAYIWLKRDYDQGLDYLQKGQILARQTGNQYMEGLCYKTIGALYFFKKEYENAIHHYQAAYNIFVEIGNHNRQARVCHDLTEAYAELGDEAQMKSYFEQGTEIARELDEKHLLQALDELARKYPGLAPPEITLNEEQVIAFEYVKVHQRITTKEYRELINTSTRTATRKLNQLVAMELFVKKGKARATYYTL